MKKIHIMLNFEQGAAPIGHVCLMDEYTRRSDYVLAIGGRFDKSGKNFEVLEFGLIPDKNYGAYLKDSEAHRWKRRSALPTVDPAKNKNGLYPEEQTVMDSIMAAYEAFLKLESEHPDELREFVDGIHRCQDVLGMRVLRRSVPTGWPTYQCEKKTSASDVLSKEAGLKPGVACWVTNILFSGRHVKVACDRNCDKAWGINTRPKEILSDNLDDYVFLADGELGIAPENPGTSEGGELKPYKPDKHNRWCVRECERASIFEPNKEVVYKDWTKRQ